MRYIQIKQATSADVGMVPDAERDAVQTCVAMSRPALAYWWGEELLAIIGFVPTAIITDTAYCWVQTFPVAAKHKLIFGRQAVLTLREVRTVYPRIIGHCEETSSMKWLRSLGAKFQHAQGSLIPFVIEG